MSRSPLLGSLAAFALAACASSPAPVPQTPPPPPTPAPAAPAQPLVSKLPPLTRADNVTDTIFGTQVADPYRWLEDASKPEVQAWMHTEDRYARGKLAELPGRDALAARLKALFYVETVSTPFKRGNRLFYARRHADQEKAVIYWREGEEGQDHVLIDPNTLSTDGSVSLGSWSPSWDGKRVAYGIKKNNADDAVVHVMEVATGEISKVDVIEGGRYASASWTPQGDGFYYTYLPTDPKIPEADRPGYSEIRFHKLGTDPKVDPLIYPATHNSSVFLGADLSRDGKWLFVTVSRGWSATDLYYREAKSKGAFKPLVTGQDAIYGIEAFQNHFYVLTNEGAPHYRIFRVDPAHPERKAWKEIVAERPDLVIEGTWVAGGKLALRLLGDAAASKLELRGLDGKLIREVPLPSAGVSSGLIGTPDDDTLFYDFASPIQPTQIFKSSVSKGGSTLWAEVKLPIDPSPYTVETVRYPSKDGTQVSMYLLHRKDMPKDGSTPFLLYGYGGFNVSLSPSFTASIYPWLEAGGGYAVAQLRGGGEYGEGWHQAGMGLHKQNVFDDFIGAAEYLVKQGYTKPERLGIRGASNGGLLVGAAMTQRPDLFRAVICGVPLLDMVRYEQFGAGKTWSIEYGSVGNEASFKALYAYSPYHHVKAGTPYPALLMLSADSDDRVDPMHARKFVAAVQAGTTSDRPVLLRIEQHAGHGGADRVQQTVSQQADSLAFLAQQLGLKLGN